MIGVARDIDRRKRAEAERDRVLAQLRVQIERMPLGYLLLDADFRIVDWNPALERLLGYRKDEMVGSILPVERLLPAAAVPLGEAVLYRLKCGVMAAHAINENLTKDGRTITCEWHNTPLFDGDGAIAGFLSLAQDISDRQRAEEELRASEQRFRQIAESIREVFWLTDPLKQEVVYVSPAYETIWGRTSASLYASPEQWMEAIHPEDRAFVLEALGTKQLRGDYDEQYRIVRPDGTIRWIRDRAFPVWDVRGQIVRVAGVAEDITERRQLQAQLAHAQKMEAVGQLAGGVAHDFNNFPTVIASCTYLLLDSLREDDSTRELVHQIMRAGQRSGTLTRQLLSFSRQQVLAPVIVNLNDVIRDTESMLRRAMGEDVELEVVLAKSLGSVRADPGQMEQVLLNLVVNARDAMPQGGTLTVETSDVQVDADDTTQLTKQLRVSHPEIEVLFISGYADDAIVRHGVRYDHVDFLQKPFAPPALALKVREVLDRGTFAERK